MQSTKTLKLDGSRAAEEAANRLRVWIRTSQGREWSWMFDKPRRPPYRNLRDRLEG